MTQRILFFVLTFVIVFLTGCKDNSLPVDKIIAETEEHIVFRSGEDYFLRFNDKYSKAYSGFGSGAIKFESVYELKNYILNNNFTENEKSDLQLQTCDEAGNIKIFDIENMYQPIFQDKLLLQSVVWSGTPTYTCSYIMENSLLHVYFSFYGHDEFEEIYTERYTDFFTDIIETYTVVEQKKQNTVEYRSETDMYKSYDVEDSGRNIKVKEFYWLNTELGYPNTEDVPFYIYMYVTDGDVNYTISIDYVSMYFTEHPGEEWLLSFGMEPLVTED